MSATPWSHAGDLVDEVDELRKRNGILSDEVAKQRARAIKAEDSLRLLRYAVQRHQWATAGTTGERRDIDADLYEWLRRVSR